jgi:DNA-binding CsgD family transcriptional regulator/PAS domain-containing protein
LTEQSANNEKGGIRVYEKDPTISTIIDDLYAGTLDESIWHRAIVAIADLVDASGAHLVGLNPSTGRVLRDETYRMDPLIASAYREHWSTKDILMAPAMTIQVGEPTPDYKLVPLETWHRCELFNELALPFDCPYILPTILHKSPDKVVALSIKTSSRHGPFSFQEAQRLKSVIPHVRRTLEIRDRLELSQIRVATLAKSLDNVSFGVMLLDAKGHVMEANDAAEQMLRCERVLRLNADRTLWLQDPAGAELQRWMIAGTPPADTDGLLKLTRLDRANISVLATPLPVTVSSWMGGEPRWLLLLFDTDRRIAVSAQIIEHDLGLTSREAELAALLAAGNDVALITRRMKISVNTARTHLKSIFAKTGACSQAELVQRITSGPSSARSATGLHN